MVSLTERNTRPSRDIVPLDSDDPRTTDTVILPGWSAQARTGVATVPD